MVEVTAEDITTIFPEFQVVDETIIDFYIESARDYVNEGRWGTPKAKRGIMFMTAHLMSRAGLLEGGGGDVQGAIVSESVGGISTTYAQPVGAAGGSELSLTSYGEQFQMLRRTVVKTPLVT